MTWSDRGNSRTAWDEAFAPGGHWDEVAGGSITAAFARCLVDNLHHDVLAYLEDKTASTILDWGCARGEMTQALRDRFHRATVVGQDFSRAAVIQARQRYGDPFVCRASIAGSWDIVVTSNVLEHLLDPLATIWEHLRHTERFYVLLCPFEEYLGPGQDLSPEERQAAGHAHVQRFADGSFPSEIGTWTRIQHQVVEPGREWPGTQVLVTYRA